MRSDKYRKNFIGKKAKDKDTKSKADALLDIWRESEAQLKAWKAEAEQSKIAWGNQINQNAVTNVYTSGTTNFPNWSIQPSITPQPYGWSDVNIIPDFGINFPESRFFADTSGNGAFFPCPLKA